MPILLRCFLKCSLLCSFFKLLYHKALKVILACHLIATIMLVFFCSCLDLLCEKNLSYTHQNVCKETVMWLTDCARIRIHNIYQ